MRLVSYPAELWAGAAGALRGEAPADARHALAIGDILMKLKYGQPLADGSRGGASEMAAIEVAAGMTEVFQIIAPDAPGLSFVGGMTQAACHGLAAGNDGVVSAGGCGADFRDAFLSCIGEAVERLALAVRPQELMTAGVAGSGLPPEAKAALVELAGGADGPVLAARNITRDADSWVPASLCLHQDGRDGIEPPSHPSTGCASGATPDRAMLAGILECVERDAAALWWQAGRPPRHIAMETLEEAGLLSLIPQIRQGAATRRSWLLDITSDLGIPCVASISFDAAGGGFVHGSAARLRLADAARAAYLEMCQMEVARHLIALKRQQRGRMSPADERHQIRFAAIDPERWPILRPQLAPAPRRPIEMGETSLAAIVDLLAHQGVECLAVDLSLKEIAVPVFKMILPGLQPMPSSIRTARLHRAAAADGVAHPVDIPLF
jgi:ribosomal protein S12 methylthiotransferase accessory factor